MSKQVATQAAARVTVQATRYKDTIPEPMKVIREREQEINRLPEQYRVPEQSPSMIRIAAREYAVWNNSDPFAYRRMFLHLSRGLELASTVYAEYKAKIRTREMAKTLKPHAVW